MSILDKFEDVEIKNDMRIAPDDLDFCERNQRLYLKVLENYKSIFDDLMEVKKKEFALFSEIEMENTYNQNSYVNRKYDNRFVTITKEEFAEIINGVHRIFVNTIYDYFTKKYGVKLEVKAQEDILRMEKPEKENFYYYGYGELSDEKLKEIERKNQEYERLLDLYRDKLIAAKVDFNNIIDDIFIQLGGYSFTDKAKSEIITACKSACFDEYRKLSYATIKKCKVVMETGFNSHFDPIWKEYEASTNNDDFKAIIRALSFFDSNEKERDTCYDWTISFIFYNMKERDGIYGVRPAHGNKVQSFKFYKNGKWEINFISQEDAEKFFNEYCKC